MCSDAIYVYLYLIKSVEMAAGVNVCICVYTSFGNVYLKYFLLCSFIGSLQWLEIFHYSLAFYSYKFYFSFWCPPVSPQCNQAGFWRGSLFRCWYTLWRQLACISGSRVTHWLHSRWRSPTGRNAVYGGGAFPHTSLVAISAIRCEQAVSHVCGLTITLLALVKYFSSIKLLLDFTFYINGVRLELFSLPLSGLLYASSTDTGWHPPCQHIGELTCGAIFGHL